MMLYETKEYENSANGKEDEEKDNDTGSENSQPANALNPQKKRAKIADPASSVAGVSSVVKGKKRKSLSLLPTMPLDILFEIFGQLAPRDIINLSRTTKTFRKLLMTRQATTIWKVAREREEVPDCPSWISEPAWAVLHFGSTCQSCGTKGVPKADFLLMKRVCVKCKKQRLVHQRKINKRFPGIDAEVLELMLATDVGGWSHGQASSSYYYWDQDVEAMISKLSILKQTAQKEGSNGKKMLAKFREERKQVIQEIIQKSDRWDEYRRIAESNRYEDIAAAYKKRLEQIEAKFLEMGYDYDDVSELRFRGECNQKAPLTDRIWKRIRPALEEFLQDCKKERLEAKAHLTQYKRRKIVAACYLDYQRTLRPSQWKYLPRVFEIMNFEPISRHLNADVDVEVTASTFEYAFNNLSEFISEAAERRKTAIRALLPPDMSGNQIENKTSSDPLDLAAMAVFECEETHSNLPYLLFGWEDISSHHCLPERESHYFLMSRQPNTDPFRIVYSPHGTKVVQKLVELAGLDPNMATVADMDQMDLIYFCDCCQCPSHADPGKSDGRFGYNWQAMATHLACSSEDHNPGFKITVLAHPETAGLKRSEGADTRWEAARWICAHCSEYLDKFCKREAVEKHLRESHGIASPTIPSDLFYFERWKSSFFGRYEFVVG